MSSKANNFHQPNGNPATMLVLTAYDGKPARMVPAKSYYESRSNTANLTVSDRDGKPTHLRFTWDSVSRTVTADPANSRVMKLTYPVAASEAGFKCGVGGCSVTGQLIGGPPVDGGVKQGSTGAAAVAAGGSNSPAGPIGGNREDVSKGALAAAAAAPQGDGTTPPPAIAARVGTPPAQTMGAKDIDGVDVIIVKKPPVKDPPKLAKTDARGGFTFTDLTAGEYAISFSPTAKPLANTQPTPQSREGPRGQASTAKQLQLTVHNGTGATTELTFVFDSARNTVVSDARNPRIAMTQSADSGEVMIKIERDGGYVVGHLTSK